VPSRLGQGFGATDPFGRKATLTYNNSGILTGITDVAGLSTTFGYDQSFNPQTYITNMVTPYGTTSFKITQWTNNAHLADGSTIARSIQITEPNGSKQEHCGKKDLAWDCWDDASPFLGCPHSPF